MRTAMYSAPSGDGLLYCTHSPAVTKTSSPQASRRCWSPRRVVVSYCVSWLLAPCQPCLTTIRHVNLIQSSLLKVLPDILKKRLKPFWSSERVQAVVAFPEVQIPLLRHANLMGNDPVRYEREITRRFENGLPRSMSIRFVVIGNMPADGIFGPIQDFTFLIGSVVPQHGKQTSGLKHSSNLRQASLRVSPMERLCCDRPSLRSIAQPARFERAIKPVSGWAALSASRLCRAEDRGDRSAWKSARRCGTSCQFLVPAVLMLVRPNPSLGMRRLLRS